jgi:hypothetical protein
MRIVSVSLFPIESVVRTVKLNFPSGVSQPHCHDGVPGTQDIARLGPSSIQHEQATILWPLHANARTSKWSRTTSSAASEEVPADDTPVDGHEREADPSSI